jgi:prophage regulatory protein
MNTEQKKMTPFIIRKSELLFRLGLSDPTIWRMERKGTFPKRLKLGGNSVGWLLSEVEAWIAGKAAARESVPGGSHGTE